MTNRSYPKDRTALLFIDPYNDFLSEGGKFWPAVQGVAVEVGLLENLRAVTAAVRKAGIQICIAPHHRWEAGDMDGWDHPTPYQVSVAAARSFEKGTWGGEWHPDFAPRKGDLVAKEHWGASGFANTDLDFQLKQRRIVKVIVIGLLANTCVETTARAATDFGYHVTLVRDATAAMTQDRMHAAHELNGPTFAHDIVTTAELLVALPRE